MQNYLNNFSALKNHLYKLRSMHVETTKNKHSITNDDIDIILNNEWLNDKLINFYMEITCEYFDNTVYAFSTHFFQQFKISDMRTILSWYKNIDLYNFKYLIFPVNENYHWTLILYNVQENYLEYFDSISGGQPKEKYFLIIQYFLQNYCTGKNIIFKELRKKIGKGFIQNNGVDCGIYTCLNARHAIESSYFVQKDIDGMIYRYKFLNEIFARRILYPINHKFN